MSGDARSREGGPVDDDVLAAAVDRGDLDELLRLVDACSTARDWAALRSLRGRCRAALERGRQLWPVASHAEYRLALEAPGPFAASVLVEGAGRFALGPLSEVAASTHEWGELAPHLTPGPVAVVTAHERVVRGEDLTGITLPGPPVLELPLRLEAWEPGYPLAEYHPDRADFPAPARPPLAPVDLPVVDPASVRRVGVPAVDALLDVVRAWTTGSDARADAVAVTGTAADAIAALGPARARWAPLDPGSALAVLGWAGASGGAHGRRPGAAAGRFSAWWAAAALAGLDDDWPPDPDRLGDALQGLRWHVWDAAEPATGWQVHLAVDEPARGLAWALAAVDAA